MTFASRLDLPPIHNEIIKTHPDGRKLLNQGWSKWFDDLYQMLGETHVEGLSRTGAPTVPVQSNINFIQLPILTTAQRDSVNSPPDGVIFYNSTIPGVQARVGAAWVTL